MTPTPFPPGFITPALVDVMRRVCPTRPLGGDLSCILQEVGEHHPDSHEDVHMVVEAFLRHQDETPDTETSDTDWDDPAWRAGLQEFHGDLLFQWESVIAFAVDHLDV